MRVTTDDQLPQIRRLLEHMAWADRRVLDMLAALPASDAGEATRLFAHLLAAERVWLLRLTGADASGEAIWPSLELARLEALAVANAAGYARLAAALRPDALQTEVAYTNSQGVAYRTAVGDVLLHVAMHGSYHRGQLAAAVRRDGGEPVNTDFITFVRAEGHGVAVPGAAIA